ncbi:MAG: hypothetical protein HZB38_17210 [Planctomycetes bacterium]|nr:hypothetical protein [Planctomycetota bacterium]
MEWRWPLPRRETYEEMRERLIAETSAFLTECLQHPEFAVRIPTIEAGKGRFPPTFSSAFWDSILAE